MTRTLAVTILALMAPGVVWAYGNSVTYSGQGIGPNGDGSYVINNEICGVTNGAPVNGPYLFWVLTANTANNANITIPGEPNGTNAMTKKGGGAFQYVSGWEDLGPLLGNVYATYDGKAKNAQLVISHGCAPKSDVGAWCSPGFWLNTLNKSPNAWNTIGVTPPGPYYNDVIGPSTDPTGPAASGSPTLLDVLQNKAAYFSSSQQGAGFNAVGAYLTNLISGYFFDPALVGTEDSCPLDAFGNFK
jgi:hypothetical protein